MDVNEVRGDNVTPLHLACAAENRHAMLTGLTDYLQATITTVTALAAAQEKEAKLAARNTSNTGGGNAAASQAGGAPPAPPPASAATSEASTRKIAADLKNQFATFSKRDLAWWLPVRLGADLGSASSAGGLSAGDERDTLDRASPKSHGVTESRATATTVAAPDASSFPWNFPLLNPKSCQGHAAVVRYLLDQGADPWVRTSSRGLHVLHVVADHMKNLVLEELMKRFSEAEVR